MHELSLTQSIVDTIAARFPDSRVTVVRLEVGRLSGVVVDAIRFCFDLVAEGTVVEGATLEVAEPAGRGDCRSCGHEFDIDDPIVLCSACGDANVRVLAGRDLKILSVEVSCAPRVAAPTTPG